MPITSVPEVRRVLKMRRFLVNRQNQLIHVRKSEAQIAPSTPIENDKMRGRNKSGNKIMGERLAWRKRYLKRKNRKTGVNNKA